jgi:hypothetical protein
MVLTATAPQPVKVVALSVNETEPPSGIGATVAVKVTLPPTVAGFDEDDIVVVVVRAPVTTLPKSSTTTHKPLLVHDTPPRVFVPSTFATVQATDPPVGLDDVATLPLLSTATQTTLVVHDTPKRPKPSTVVVVHAAAPPVGLVDVTT